MQTDHERLEETKLFQLVKYGFARAVGHTFTELNGVKNNPKAILIVADESQKRNLNLPKEQMISLSQIPESLRGLRKPIVIDHYALQILVDDLATAILKDFISKSELREKLPKDTECYCDKISSHFICPNCIRNHYRSQILKILEG